MPNSKMILPFLLAALLAGCAGENNSKNVDGTCKSGFIDAYNAAVEAVNASNAKVIGLKGSLGIPSGAQMSDTEASLVKAQNACNNLLGNFSGNGNCEANRTAKAEDLAEPCSNVDSNLVAVRKLIKAVKDSETTPSSDALISTEMFESIR